MALWQPDLGATLNGTSFIAFLSQRDLALDIPVNYVPVAGVALTAACFSNNIYDSQRAGKCISNLLASRFQAFEIDVYWDASRALWSLCPVQLHVTNSSAHASSRKTSALASRSQTTSPALSSTILSTAARHARRLIPTLTAPTLSTIQADLQQSTVTIGNFSCSAALDLGFVTDVLFHYFEDTDTNLNATLNYLVLNVHAAASAASPNSPALMPPTSQLPDSNSTLSSLLFHNLTSYLYAPSDLSMQRSSLNAMGSWLYGNQPFQPDKSYFNVTDAGNLEYSRNGWPGEGFIEQSNAKRLLVGFGRIDPQMSQYNFSSDAEYIFNPGYIQQLQSASSNAASSGTNSCFFKVNDTSLLAANSSWAASEISGVTTESANGAAQALAQCGFTPYLNQTLQGQTADQSYGAYRSFALSASIWSWSEAEPKTSNKTPQSLRCAALNTTSGRWQARDCEEDHHASCRLPESPYAWAITESSVSFTYAGAACEGDTTFDVPRTALQNRHLLNQWQNHNAASTSGNRDDLLWLNLNDLDASSCWVSQGANATCPYANHSNPDDRTVIIPAVAALIIFIIVVLLMFVKCAANRRSSKRSRRRRADGWDYEGVPL